MNKKQKLALAALVFHIWQAGKHQRTCPKCRGRDLFTVALDFAHLIQVA